MHEHHQHHHAAAGDRRPLTIALTLILGLLVAAVLSSRSSTVCRGC